MIGCTIAVCEGIADVTFAASIILLLSAYGLPALMMFLTALYFFISTVMMRRWVEEHRNDNSNR